MPIEPYYDRDGITIYHGDCLDVLPELREGTIDLILTDPPYNISAFNGRDNTTIGKIKRSDGSYREIVKDFGSWDRGFDPGDLIIHAARLLDEDGGFVAFTSDVLAPTYITASALTHRRLCVWHKTNAQPVFRGVGYQQSAEFIEWRTKGKATFYGGGAEPSVFTGPGVPASERCGHPTEKPLWLIRRLVELHSRHGDLILDPFMGSGTTLRAAKDLGRRAIGIELEEKWCEEAVKRLAQEVLPL